MVLLTSVVAGDEPPRQLQPPRGLSRQLVTGTSTQARYLLVGVPAYKGRPATLSSGNCDVGRGQGLVGGLLVLPPHPTPHLFDEGWVGHEEGFYLRTGHRCSSVLVSIEHASDMAFQGMDPRLDSCRRSPQGNSITDGAPGHVGYTHLLTPLRMRRFGYQFTEIRKYCVYPCGFQGQVQRERCLLHKV